MSDTILSVNQLTRIYRGATELQVLAGVSLNIARGASVALLGASGSGKSTLLNCIGLLDQADGGEIILAGENVTQLSHAQRAKVRLKKIGFVFQFHHLIPELTALENVEMPSSIAGRTDTGSAKELLDAVGLSAKLKSFPWQLSGGEQQRVAVARALVNKPEILLTDEATGNLDRPRAKEIIELLLKISRERSMTLLSVTHDEELASKYGQQYRLVDGKVEGHAISIS